MSAGGPPLEDALAHELFELWANATPNAIALRFRDDALSYGELNARANRLARYLDATGVRGEDHVVVCVEPGFEIIVALLAILKLGAVYVPLDPSYPPARLQIMLDDTRPVVVLTHSQLREKLPFGERRAVALDTSEELRSFPANDLRLAIEPSRTAYVYYTSGTTGTPKGVVASHANLMSYLGSARRRYDFGARDVGVAIARFTFSISMFELLSPLSSGGSLILLERAHVLDPPRLAETLREVSFFHAGPSLLRGVLDHIKRHYRDFSAFAGVRHASSGGDTVPPEVLQDLRSIFGNAEIFVIYGCSEISCMGTTYEVPREGPLERTYVGKPFEGTTLRVVDDDLVEVPPGTVGEVLFAGPGVVKGYLNRPELTAERFIDSAGLRFYRTGDRGKRNEQDLLELVGRSDFQVKLAGIRIELGEIEHHLRRAPEVANGIVSAVERDGEKELAAYVVIRSGAGGDGSTRAAEIRRYLATHLPDYMVPRIYVELDALPLNHNLKVDRRALPAPPLGAARFASATARPPRTPVEQRLAALWRAVLGADVVGLDDHFFDVGGTSLLALRLIQEVDRELAVRLSGLEVLRESLEVQARLCHQRSGQAPEQEQPSRSGADSAPRELFHFGPDHSLYGVLHRPGPPMGERAALICAPLGHEYVRAHFVLQRLASRLAAAGIPTLRFDYYGCFDSCGDPRGATCERWQRDIVAAKEELQQRTGARHVTAVGARLGATLLMNAAKSSPFSKLVLWDAIEDGARHLAELRAAHRRLLRASPLPSLRQRLAGWTGRHELLGSTFSEPALRELKQLVMPGPSGSSGTVERLSTDTGWLDLRKLEEMLPDTGISRQLSQLALGSRP